ncbi:MAG TPA: hypothetical protein VJN92_12425 [Candidatus Acidoferrum sp.]|nr:hypothetical protein [Candidatus Acidoferrum sp.]
MKPGRPRSLKYPDGTPVEVEGVSRQRRWQIARRAAGKCEWCGQPLNKYAAMCDDCAKSIRERARKRGGFKAWQPGSRGRPPKDMAKSKAKKGKIS